MVTFKIQLCINVQEPHCKRKSLQITNKICLYWNEKRDFLFNRDLSLSSLHKKTNYLTASRDFCSGHWNCWLSFNLKKTTTKIPCCSFCIETAPRLPYILDGSSSGIQFEFEYFHCAYYLWQGPSMISKICNWTLWNRFKGKEVQTFYQQKSNRRFFERALKVASKYILGLLLWIHFLAILV